MIRAQKLGCTPKRKKYKLYHGAQKRPPLTGAFSLFFSLFLLFTLLYWWFFLLVQVKQIGVVLQIFYYNRGGRGGFVQGVGGEGIVNCGGKSNKNEANELTTLLQRLKYWLKR